MDVIGTRVVRGPDWKWGDQDGGEGHVGTVVSLGKGQIADRPEKTVMVMWDSGKRNNYRAGFDNLFDLRILDNAQTGIVHPDVSCSICQMQGIRGIRWKCFRCFNCNLCSLCFMNGNHEISHDFQRFSSPESAGTTLYTRHQKQEVEARGLFPGAQVQRGNDWRYGDQDGGDSSRPGHVIDVRGWHDDENRAGVGVRWPCGGGDKMYRYRVGADGKVDIKCVQMGHGGTYYPQLLPKLGQSDGIHVGDTVVISFNKDTLKSLRDARLTVPEDAAKKSGEKGVVKQVTNLGELHVQCTGGETVEVHPIAVHKVASHKVGDRVRVVSDQALVQSLQRGHGGWNTTMRKVLGRDGKVEQVYDDGDVKVRIEGSRLLFNAACLVQVDSSQKAEKFEQGHQDSMQSLLDQAASLAVDTDEAMKRKLSKAAALGRVEDIRDILTAHPEWVDVPHSDRTPLQVAAHQGQLGAVQELLTFNPSLEAKDKDGDTALLYSAYGNAPAVMRFLLEHGAYVNIINKQMRSCLHVSARRGYLPCVELLLKNGCRCNMQDKSGDMALHDAIHKDKRDVIRCLVTWSQADLTVRNGKGFSVLHYAAFRGNAFAADCLLSQQPSLATMRMDTGQTPLHVAASNNFKDVAAKLVRRGAETLEYKDNQNQTPLLIAVAGGHVHIIELLVEAGADVNAADTDGDTCMHLAVLRFKHNPSGKESAVFKHLCHGVEETLLNTPGMALLVYLIQRGARIDLCNHSGKTAIQLLENSAQQKDLTDIYNNRHPQTPKADPMLDSVSHVVNLPYNQQQLQQPQQRTQQQKQPHQHTQPKQQGTPKLRQEDTKSSLENREHPQPTPAQPAAAAQPGDDQAAPAETASSTQQADTTPAKAGFEGIHRIDVKKELELLEQIGKGSFAEVYRGRWRGTIVAVKKMSIDGSRQSDIEQEVAIHKKALHPNIVQLMALGYHEVYAYLVITYINGFTLQKAVFPDRDDEKCSLTVAEKNLIARDVLCALTFMHASGLLHLDIKPSNILLERATLKPYLCDLGLSYIKRRAEMSLSSRLVGPARGTLMYMAPELHEDDVKVTDAQDVWSVACTFIEMFGECHVHPRTMTHLGLMKKIMGGKIVPDSLQKVKEPHKSILQLCLKPNPKDRPSASELHAKFEKLCEPS